MAFSKILTASLLGLATFSSSAVAQSGSAKAKFCEKFPNSSICEDASGDAPVDSSIGGAAAISPDPSSSDPKPSPSNSKPAPPPKPEKRPPGVSSAKCFAVSIGNPSSGGDSIAEAASDAAAYMCGDGGGSATAVATAEASATLFARAVAEASVGCDLCGDAGGYANAYAKATSAAEGWLVAYAEAFADASVCNKCDAFAESWGYVEEYVFLKAVTEAKATVEGYTSKKDQIELAVAVHDYSVEVKEAVVSAFAEAIANAAVYHDSSECFAWVNTNGCIYSPEEADPEKCFECVVSSASDSFIYSIDAISEAKAEAAAITCGTESFAEADVHVLASALAEATAVAISSVYINCEADEGAYACADAGTFIEDAAHATASAFADAWAIGLDCTEDCVVDAEAATYSFGEILATAASSAYGSVCVDGGEQWSLSAYQIDIETKLLEAVAEAGAFVISSVDEHGNSECLAAVFADTSVAPV